MLNFVAATVLGCCGLVCSEASACNCDCDLYCCCTQAAAPAAPAASPAPAPEQKAVPAVAPQARVRTQYRTYSYQPAPVYQPAAVVPYRMYSNRAPAAGFHDAGWKARGAY